MSAQVILHIPHSSTDIPGEIRPSISLSDDELRDELLKMTDRFTDELFTGHSAPVSPVIFPVSRLVLDPERFLDDKQEPMSQKGMGVVYTKTSAGNPLREGGFLPDRAALVHAYYEPHHDLLTRLAARSIQEARSCMVIDCHSFPSKALPFEDPGKARPAICVGTDSFHTPAWLAEQVTRLFQAHGLKVELNSPFSGALVPGDFYGKERDAYAIMIEVNRALYMDERSGKKSRDFSAIKKLLGEAIDSIDAAWRSYSPAG